MTKDLTYTPGPWQIVEMDLAGVELFIVPPGAPANPINDIASLVVDGHPLGRERQVANARLIAEAPELLQALRELLHECEEAGFATAKDYGWPRVFRQSREAINKAIGHE